MASGGLYYLYLSIMVYYSDTIWTGYRSTHMNTILLIFLSISPWTAALLTFNEDFFFLQLTFSCFIFLGMLHFMLYFCASRVNGLSIHISKSTIPNPHFHIHILRIDSFSFTFKSFNSSPFRARPRVKWSFASALVVVFVSISSSSSRVKVVHYKRKKLAAGLDPSELPS